MLEIKNLVVAFDGLRAVDGVSLSVHPKTITSIIGPNGAGKTTLFNAITGFLAPKEGVVLWRGENICAVPPWKIARAGIARTFQQLRVFGRMSVLENVLIGMRSPGEDALNALFMYRAENAESLKQRARAHELLDFVGLAPRSNDLAETLSYGNQKLLSIACCLATDAELLMLDEPVAGVQPETIETIIRSLQKLVQSQGKTVLFIEHNMDVVLRISDHVIVMDEGKILAQGTPAEIRGRKDILEAYLT